MFSPTGDPFNTFEWLMDIVKKLVLEHFLFYLWPYKPFYDALYEPEHPLFAT